MGLFKRKTKDEPVKSLKAFISGTCIPITEVNAPVFSSKTLGDGIAIKPQGQVITAPCAGEISMVAEESNHAIGMTLNNGAEILIHVGLDTVSLKGKGFETTSVLVVTNSDEYPDLKFADSKAVTQNETEIVLF